MSSKTRDLLLSIVIVAAAISFGYWLFGKKTLMLEISQVLEGRTYILFIVLIILWGLTKWFKKINNIK